MPAKERTYGLPGWIKEVLALLGVLLSLWGFVLAPMDARVDRLEARTTRSTAQTATHIEQILGERLRGAESERRRSDAELVRLSERLQDVSDVLSRIDERTRYIERDVKALKARGDQ